MRRRTLPAALALAILATSTVAAQSREFARTVDLQPTGTLRVDGSKGSIRLTSWDRPQVEVRARIERPEEVADEYARQAVDATEIEVTSLASGVSVRTNYDRVPKLRDFGHGDSRAVPDVHYEIRAPRRIELHVNSDRGPATISGFEGTVDIVLDRGELDLSDAVGDVRIEIDRGERSRVSGVRGSLQVDSDRTDLRIETVGLDRDSRIEADRGEIDLAVPTDQRLTVRTDISRRGSFDSDFPIQWMSSDPRRSEGHLNGGGPELRIESDRASIGLRKR